MVKLNHQHMKLLFSKNYFLEKSKAKITNTYFTFYKKIFFIIFYLNIFYVCPYINKKN